MKLYVFITNPIIIAGGTQCYVAAKAKYLESLGWKVVVFSPNLRSGELHTLIHSMSKYLNGNVVELALPPFKYPSFLVKRVLKRMETIIGDISSFDEKIIETHEDIFSQWGELLARKVKARHYFFLMNEFFRGANCYYEAKMDFYNFKFNRREIEGRIVGFERLFKGYREIQANDLHGELVIDECPIQEYDCKTVDDIQKADWSICYIGRGNKSYVPNILSDVGKFAGLYPDKKIQLVTIGDLDIHRQLINDIIAKYKNLTIDELGFLHPLPLSLYKKIDVVIAGAGSARHSCEEGAIVIVADTETKMSNGILGYETLEGTYKSDDSVCTDFVDALKRVLIDKVYLTMPYRFRPKIGVEEQTKFHFELFSKSEKKLEYYNKKELLEGRVDYVALLKLYAYNHIPISILRCLYSPIIKIKNFSYNSILSRW